MLNFNIFKILIPNIQSSISFSSIKFVDREYEVYIITVFCIEYISVWVNKDTLSL